jgi:hypothetical protein
MYRENKCLEFSFNLLDIPGNICMCKKSLRNSFGHWGLALCTNFKSMAQPLKGHWVTKWTGG